jgi:hypothetical protein
MPADGNFLAMAGWYGVTVTDSMQNAYIQSEPGGSGYACLNYAVHTSVRLEQLLPVNVPSSLSAIEDVTWMDIRGVATSSPIDTTAYNEQAQPSMTNGYQWSGIPTIAPSASGELVIADLPTGCGPSWNVVAPSGAITDNVYYSGATDESNSHRACGHVHLVTRSTAQESWTWVMENASCVPTLGVNYSASAAWAIKAQPTTARSVTPAHASIF